MTHILFIASMGRSGSTILDSILGQIPSFVSVGEIKFIWERGLKENRRCGCGKHFRSCPFWTQVFEEAFGGMDAVDSDELIAELNTTRTRHFPSMLMPGSGKRYSRRHASYLRDLGRLYRAVAKVSGCSVIVDSSKYPSHAFVLDLIDDLEVKILHVTRDPRAVAYSWTRVKYDPDQDVPVPMPRQPAWLTAIYWNAWNVAIEALAKQGRRPYRMLRYEDLMIDPEPRMHDVLEFAGQPDEDLPFTGKHEVRLSANHTVSGNPIRFDTGTVLLKADDRWRTRMPNSAAVVTNLITWPVRARLGYRHPDSPLS